MRRNFRWLLIMLILNLTIRYWDEVRDVGTGLLAASPVFDNVYGFGGNGRASDGCVVDGPFANTTVHLGPAYQVTNYCLRRTFNEARFTGAAQSSVDVCNAYNDYVSYAFCLEASPHGAGHIGVGGLVSSSNSFYDLNSRLTHLLATRQHCQPWRYARTTILSQEAPTNSFPDPMFFMHHAYIDYQWWNWQKANLTSRLVDMGGRNTPDPAYFVRSPLIKPVPAAWYEVDGDPGNVTTLNHNLGSLGIYPNATIKDVMNIQGGYLCYEYV